MMTKWFKLLRSAKLTDSAQQDSILTLSEPIPELLDRKSLMAVDTELLRENISKLPLDLWTQIVTRRFRSLTVSDMTSLYEESRAMRHNGIRASMTEINEARSVIELLRCLHRLSFRYCEFNEMSAEKLNAIVLSSIEDRVLQLLNYPANLVSLRVHANALCNEILLQLNALVKIFEEFRVSPEQILQDAIDQCRSYLREFIVDTTGLQDELLRVERFLPREQILEVFGNLLRNAIESRRTNSVPYLQISSHSKDGKTVLLFRDNGIGIHHDQQPLIFNDGYSSKQSEGIGLARSKRTLEAIGGSIRLVESEPNVGTQFEVIL